MTEFQAPADIAVAFIEAFGRRDTAAVAALLADDVVFESPRATLAGADAVAAAIGGFAQAVTGVKIISALGDDERATVVYDMATEAYGTLRAADHVTVSGGRITSDTLVFDAGRITAPAPPEATVIRYDTLPESADANQALIEGVFAQLAAERPGDVRYTVFRDGTSFTHVVVNGRMPSPLGDLAAFQEFQRAFADRVAGGPSRVDTRVVGAYRMMG
ncbi:MAG TPA: nuclear transport factor 2 family protein [Streptosporangiaceae bacterium]|jgi:ketosteroid isomerase-like protein